MARSRAPWSTPDLRERCKRLRAHLADSGTATLEELKAYWPGGDENQEPRKGAWIFCYAQLIRMQGRTERLRNADDVWQRALDQALADEPKRVDLTCGTFHVYPKSAHALLTLDALDASLLGSIEAAAPALEQGGAAAEAVRALFPRLQSIATRVWSWVITEPDPGLPFNDDTELEPPQWTGELAPEDLVALWLANRDVNGRRNATLAEAFPGDGGPSRLTLGGFVGSYAHEKGGDAKFLWRRTSIGQLYAKSLSATIAFKEAEARAKPRTGPQVA